MKLVTKLSMMAGAVVASAQGALAQAACDPSKAVCEVPEISALEGTAAIAALAAVVLLTWERSRRRSA